MARIDLHLHTYYSDGAESPERVVERASEAGYTLISITDHDGTGGIKEALAAGKKHGIEVLPGIELSSEFEAALGGLDANRYFMHILGYEIDPDYPPLRERLDFVMSRRAVRNGEIQEALIKKGIKISDRELAESSPDGFIGKLSFAKAFVRRGLCGTVAEAFRSPELLASPEIRVIRKDKISAEEALNLIRSAGGKAFFAHPFQLSYIGRYGDGEDEFRRKLRLVIEAFKEMGLYGIECYYPTHDEEQTAFLLEIADGLGLAASRGSDDHGEGIRELKRIGPFRCDISEDRERILREIFCVN